MNRWAFTSGGAADQELSTPGSAHAGTGPTVPVPFEHPCPGVTLLSGDAAEVLRIFPDGAVDCVVTSPPYWRLRDYTTGTWRGGNPRCAHPVPTADRAGGPADRPQRCPHCGARWTDDQYGREPTPDRHVEHLRHVFAELQRVLTPTGTAWLNLGDSYATNSDGYYCTRPGQYRQLRFRPAADLPHKNLLGMPWRVAFALLADGWILRNAIIWHKPNAAPFPVRDRLGCQYEWLFLLVKQDRYHFDLDPICQPYTGDRTLTRRAHHSATKPHTARGIWPPPHATRQDSESPGRNPGDMWTIPVTPQRHAEHPAAFPLELPLRCIAAGCPPHGTVLDPFSGTGTTGLAARQLDRPFIGIDLNPAFHALARTRLVQTTRRPSGTADPGEHPEAA